MNKRKRVRHIQQPTAAAIYAAMAEGRGAGVGVWELVDAPSTPTRARLFGGGWRSVSDSRFANGVDNELTMEVGNE